MRSRTRFVLIGLWVATIALAIYVGDRAGPAFGLALAASSTLALGAIVNRLWVLVVPWVGWVPVSILGVATAESASECRCEPPGTAGTIVLFAIVAGLATILLALGIAARGLQIWTRTDD